MDIEHHNIATCDLPIMPLREIGAAGQRACSGAFAIRTDGLLGDNVVASTAFGHLFEREGGRPAVLYSTYRHDPGRLQLLGDLFRELVHAGAIRAILFEGRAHGPLTDAEAQALCDLGCLSVYDCGPWEHQFQQLPKTEPLVGWSLRSLWRRQPSEVREVGVFRWSGFHRHYPLRNRPWYEWEVIQSCIRQAGYVPVVFGTDDPHPSGSAVLDLRGTLSVYDTLRRMATCRAIVSTVTFAPLFAQHYRPCFVVSDPGDVDNLRQRWKVSSRYHLYDATAEYLPRLCADLIATLAAADSV